MNVKLSLINIMHHLPNIPHVFIDRTEKINNKEWDERRIKRVRKKLLETKEKLSPLKNGKK